MKRSLLLIGFLVWRFAGAQILCIQCFDQNDSLSSGVHNLILNGSFENTTCMPYHGTLYSYCPSSSHYACTLENWVCTGGGTDTYAVLFDATYVVIADGTNAAYFGNRFCNPCSSTADDLSCLAANGCETTGTPAGYPLSGPTYGGTAGVSLQQTVAGLVPGNVYVLEFWSGGEWGFPADGLFSVNVGFGNTFLRDPVTLGTSATGRRYLIQFIADSTSHTVKFTNWGHICTGCTELILDNVRLYTINELSKSVTNCSTVINEQDKKQEIALYPNPSDGTFTLTMPVAKHSLLEIFNTFGETEYSSTISDKHQALNPQLRAGIYFVKVSNKEWSAVQKLVVVK